MEPMKHLQSGGFADVFLETRSLVCYKIFRRPEIEEKEFKIAKYLLCKYETQDKKDDCMGSVSSRVMKYLDHGYMPKSVVLDIYKRAFPNNFEAKQSELMENFSNIEKIPYICMEYIPGKDAMEYGLKYGHINETTTINLLHSLLLSVQEFHDIGLLHRDIKPDNVMIYKTEYGNYEVKLIDLGFATKRPFHHSQAVFDSVIGTKSYMAPESREGWHSTASDLFSCGMSLRVLCGDRLSKSSKVMQLLYKITSRDPTKRGTVSEAIQALREIQMKQIRRRSSTADSSDSMSSGSSSESIETGI